MPVQYSYTSTPLWAVRPVQSLSACTVQLYLYSPYGPYGLYRVSVPAQYSYTSTPLSACTVQLYLYSPCRPYGLYRASVPVQYSYTSTPPMGRTDCTEPQCLHSTAIPLLPSVPVQYSYTSTPPVGCMACTEPQFLYKGQLYTFTLPENLTRITNTLPGDLCRFVTVAC